MATSWRVLASPFPRWRTTVPGRRDTFRLPPGADYARSSRAAGETGGPAACPWVRLAAGSGTDKKTMERHRKYLVAILLAFTNGYEIIRGHLCQIAPAKGGGGK